MGRYNDFLLVTCNNNTVLTLDGAVRITVKRAYMIPNLKFCRLYDFKFITNAAQKDYVGDSKGFEPNIYL